MPSCTAGRCWRQHGELVGYRLNRTSKLLPLPLPLWKCPVEEPSPRWAQTLSGFTPRVLLRGRRSRDDFLGGLDLHFYILQDLADLSLLVDLIILGYLGCAL